MIETRDSSWDTLGDARMGGPTGRWIVAGGEARPNAAERNPRYPAPQSTQAPGGRRNHPYDELVQACPAVAAATPRRRVGLNDDPTDQTEGSGSQCLCETFFYAAQDANFNVTNLFESDGDLAERYAYTPYGQRQPYKPADGSDAFGTEAIPHSQPWQISSEDQPYGLCDVGHQGLLHDKETGLIYNRRRYLHPRLGRPMQRDPMDYAASMSVYEYCGSNPVKRHDPSGLDWWPPYLWGEDLDSHHRMLAKYNRHNARSAGNRERKLERKHAQARTEKMKDKAALDRLWREIERAREIRANALHLAATSRSDALAAGERGFQEGWVDATLGLSQGLEEVFSLGGRVWDPVHRSRYAYTRSSFEFARSGGHVAGVATLGAFGLTAAGELGLTQVGNVPLTQIPAQVATEATALAEGARRLHADEIGGDANKLNHIFGKAAHGLDGVVKQFGSPDSAYQAIQQATEAAVKAQEATGLFRMSVQVGTETITVKGKVVEGVVKIGTAFK